MIAAKLIPMARRALVLVGLCAGCHSPCDEGYDRLPVDPCRTHQCEYIEARAPGEAPYLLKGAAFDIRDFGLACPIDVSWPLSNERSRRFQAMVLPEKGDLFPLRDGLVELSFCQPLRHQPPVRAPYAAVVVNPDTARWPPLAPDEVFIPMRGDATLDETTYVSVRSDRQPDGGVASPFISVFFSSAQAPYRGLREGDAFRWGDTEARIVRIVRTCDWWDSCGWVVVRLSARTTPT